MFKTSEEIIVIQAEATTPIPTGVVFWSHDKGTAKLIIQLKKDHINQTLPQGTIVTILLEFNSATAANGRGRHIYHAVIENALEGIVSIVLEDNILGYVGRVDGSVYIDLSDSRSLDTAGRFTFDIRRSPIDEDVPELEDYYFNGFSQTIDKITKANQDVATLNTNIDKANDRIDQTNQQIGDLGKLKKIYSNSIDFGDYDYSGRANLAPNLDFSKLSGNGIISQPPLAYVKGRDSYFTIDNTDPSAVGTTRNVYVPKLGRLEKGKTYIASVPLLINSDFDTNISNISIYPYTVTVDGVVNRLGIIRPDENCRNKWYRYSIAFTVPSNFPDGDHSPYMQVWEAATATGKISIDYDIKIEKVTSTSDTATPYQPNLLDAPYYLSNIPLGENILKPASFPINTTEYMAANFTPNEPYVQGQKYTFTMKASKPSTQTFGIYLRAGSLPVGNMVPVEGLADVWQLTFEITQNHIDGSANALNVFQAPKSTKGTVNIEWAKLEKGDTRTPNISQFKYFGEGLKDSNNPNDYDWQYTDQYVDYLIAANHVENLATQDEAEAGEDNTKTMTPLRVFQAIAKWTKDKFVSMTENETVLGIKNFANGLQVNGRNVLSQKGEIVFDHTSETDSSIQSGIVRFKRYGDWILVNFNFQCRSTDIASGGNLIDSLEADIVPSGSIQVDVTFDKALTIDASGKVTALWGLEANKYYTGSATYFAKNKL